MARVKNISDFMSSLQFLIAFFADFLKRVEKLGISAEELYKALNSAEKRQAMAEACAGVLKKVGSFLSISSSLSLSDRIALGKYGWVNSDITEENFPEKVGKDYEVEYKVFHFNRSISSESAIAEMEKEGFRAGNLAELLKLGEIKPELQREFPIVALGSTWRDAGGARYVPVLGCDDGRRRLGLHWFGGGWGGNVRFLGVRK